MQDYYEQWCRQMWALLSEGGTWGVPRSGLVFVKLDGELVEVARMPWTTNMPCTEEQLRHQQQGDFEEIRAQFQRIVVNVR